MPRILFTDKYTGEHFVEGYGYMSADRYERMLKAKDEAGDREGKAKWEREQDQEDD